MAEDRKITVELPLYKQDSGRSTVAQMELQTRKSFRGGVQSSATVYWIGRGFKTHALFGDFSVTLEQSEVRATQRAIDDQHNRIFTPKKKDELVAKVLAFYEAKPERERPKRMKSMGDSCAIGDFVDEGVVEHYIGVLPPACMRSNIIQIGEPHDHIDGRPTFSTLIRKGDEPWQYAGNCFLGQSTEPMAIAV